MKKIIFYWTRSMTVLVIQTSLIFFFKMSHERMDIAMKTNKDGYHFLQEEYCYFDGKVKWRRNYVTLKGWCMNVASANMNSLQKVFGDNILTCNKTCEFHFKESRNIVARKLNDGNGKVFDQTLSFNLETTYLNTKKRSERIYWSKVWAAISKFLD